MLFLIIYVYWRCRIIMDTQGGSLRRDRRYFIGGSDARIIMGDDEAALIRLWREKRGEVKPEDLSGNLIVQLGVATEDLNRRWYQAITGQLLTDVQRQVRHPALRWMAATLDGRVESTGAVFEAKFMLPWAFSEEAAAEKHMPQLQHNMWVVAARTPPSASSGAVWRAASPLASLESSHPSLGSRRSGLWT
jgi:predicted phage-related endonuclease